MRTTVFTLAGALAFAVLAWQPAPADAG